MRARLLFSPSTLTPGALRLPLVRASISAGEPEAIADPLVEDVDLNRYLIREPGNTYGFVVQGDSMIDAGIESGDLLIVERGATPSREDICLFELDGEYTIKRLGHRGQDLYLVAANRQRAPKRLREDQSCAVWGVVRWILKPR